MSGFTPKVVTANALIEGDVIYLCADDTWSRELASAEVIADEAIAQMRLLDAQRQPGRVVGAYLADVIPGPQGPQPAHFREDFRRKGPSNYAHGKQELGKQELGKQELGKQELGKQEGLANV